MKNARGGGCFSFSSPPFFPHGKPPPALRRRGLLCPSGPEENEGPQWDIFLRLPPQEGGQSCQGQGGASGFRHLGEKHGGIGLKIHGHGRVVQNAVVQEFDIVQAGRYLCQGECVISCSRNVYDDRICGEPLKRQGGVFPRISVVRSEVPFRIRLLPASMVTVSAPPRESSEVRVWLTAEIWVKSLREARRLSTVTWSSTRLLSPLTLVPPLMFPAYLSKP